MIKQGITVGVLFALCVSLASCSYFMPHHNQDNKLPSRLQLCSQLRNQLIFNNDPIGPNMTKSSTIQRARVMKEFQRYNCDDLETAATQN